MVEDITRFSINPSWNLSYLLRTLKDCVFLVGQLSGVGV